ncbi:dimethylsulfone monooxygenase SfnG [Litorihabitans aurantiacus]|uniref:Dimethyl sulfone monooxygenase SfnG n=1 Tax=Litorihabitans aurantiacus TaxID=1930061 RepID=A0AA37XHI7_9MICO|nr:dimethyl sulfone monooxygenase SfnG [Litorihabitans aurantiacus]GMA33333.1 dimethyl sulfone monooxygenase SfnG [Litorihabitans aurantiacus]
MTATTRPADPARFADPLKFAYWVPNVSGGLVVSTIEQRTDWGYDYNKQLGILAEQNGFEYALSQVRYIASYGAAYQHESTSISLAIALATERLKVIAAVHPGLWQPGVLAKLIASADQITGGRMAVNVVSGWFKDEFTKLGEPWLEHGERYRRSEEFIRYVREIWTSEHAEFSGDFYNLHDFDLRPKPVEVPGRRHPEIFMGGNSTDARGMGGRVTDWYFMNGNTPEGIAEQVRDVSEVAREHSREGAVRFGVNGFLIGRDSEAEARDVLREIIAKADRQAVEGFGSAVKQAGQSTGDKKGMWQDSEFADLVQYNDGFRTGLVGTPEQIAERILEYKRTGANLMLLGFLHYHDDVQYFGREVLPLVRELEAAELARV